MPNRVEPATVLDDEDPLLLLCFRYVLLEIPRDVYPSWHHYVHEKAYHHHHHHHHHRRHHHRHHHMQVHLALVGVIGFFALLSSAALSIWSDASVLKEGKTGKGGDCLRLLLPVG